MAAHAARAGPPPDPEDGFSRETIANLLVGRRSVLVSQVPRRIKRARSVTRDLHEWIVDDAIDFLVTENKGVIRNHEDLEKAFWSVAQIRVQRALEGRYDLVRAGWSRVDLADVDMPDDAETPEEAAVRSFEHGMVEEFQAVLTDFEQQVLAVKYGGPEVRARFHIARQMGVKPVEVRRAERAIERKLKQFSAIVAAGRLCEKRGDALDAVLFGRPSEDEVRLAHAHLEHCVPCRSYYVRLVRAVSSGRLQREIGQIAPAPAAELARHRRSPWEAFVDWLSRPFGHDAATMSQLGAAGRGASTLVGTKLLAVCMGGVAAVGGSLYCVGKLDGSPPSRAPNVARATPRLRPTPAPSRTPVGTATATATSPPTPTPRKTHVTSRGRKGGESRSTSSSHEQAVAVSPPATTSSGAPVDEFGPGPTSAAVRRPAAAPANGGPEFP